MKQVFYVYVTLMVLNEITTIVMGNGTYNQIDKAVNLVKTLPLWNESRTSIMVAYTLITIGTSFGVLISPILNLILTCYYVIKTIAILIYGTK